MAEPETPNRLLSVVVEWDDPQRLQTREFLLKYSRDLGQVEMYDIAARRVFLKKSPAPEPLEPYLTLGTSFVLYSRTLKVKAYGDEYTKGIMAGSDEVTCIVVSADAPGGFGKALSKVEALGYPLKGLKLVELNGTEASELVEALELPAQDVEIYGTTKTLALRVQGPSSVLKQLCGPGIHASAGSRLRHLLFERPLATQPAKFGSCTCCVIKPHVLAEKNAGAVIAHIEDAGFPISALQLFHLKRDQANEFLEVYDGVLSDYDKHVNALTLGPCIALELQTDVLKFRDASGPWDVDFAKELRPTTIRAIYGKDNIRNAVHCTDLPEDGDSESKYFFLILNGLPG